MMLRFLTVVILAGSVLTGCGGTWRSETRTETEINPEHVKGSDTPRTPMSIKETPSMVYTLPPPEKKAPKSRDFNELIPRLMNPVNTNKDPVQAAANLFNVTSPDERRDAIAYLSTKPYGHDSAYMKAYYLLTTDPHAMVRGQAMRALGASQKSDAIPYLIKGLGDAESQVRRDAARGLMDTYDDSAITALADRMLKDSDDQTRVACAKALKQAKTPEAYRALIEALSDPNAAVVVNAHKALTANTGQTLGHNPRPWLEWYQQTHVKTAAPPTP